MAHCSSSLVNTPSFAAHTDAHHLKSQEILPPRKRYVKATSLISGVLTPTPMPAQSEAHVATTHAPPPSPPPPPPPSLLIHSPTHKCFSCGDVGILLHRVPCLAGSSSYHCSSCVLSSNKKMYCVLCFQVIMEGSVSSSSSSPASSASSLLTCCRCQRLTHLDCALKIWSPSLEGAGLTLCKDCYTRNNGQFREPPTKKQKIASARRSKQAVVSACKVKLPIIDKQALTAARIVAITAKREAFEAKQRAMILAKAAARAAGHAKAALDNAYQVSRRKHDNEEPADVDVNVAHKDEGGVATVKSPRISKRRALSAIVASEMLARDLTMANRMSTIEHSTKHRRRTGSYIDNAEATSSHAATVKASTHRAARSFKMGIKRRKTLSSLGLQHPSNTHTVAISKGSKSSTRKPRGSNVTSKGKLGAIVSQVLALSKVSKGSSKASDKMRGVGLPCITPDDAGVDRTQESAGRMNAIASSTDTILNHSLQISRGTIGSIDTCNPSQNGLVMSYDKRVQERKSVEASIRRTDATHVDGVGMMQEQLIKGRFGGYEQEKNLLNFLTKTMPSRKPLYANGVTTTRVTSKR